MIKGRVVGGFAVVAAAACALSSPVAAGPILRYMGAVSCGEWISGESYSRYPKAATLNWVLGYLSHSATILNADLLGNVDQASVAAWMDNYCQANPLNTVIDGAKGLEVVLFARVHPAEPPPAAPPAAPTRR